MDVRVFLPTEEALKALAAGTALRAQLELIKANPKLKRVMLSRWPLHRLIGKPEPTTTTTAQEEPEREFDEKMATLLLDVFGAQALLECHSSTGYGPLMWACLLGNVKAARFLLDAGADVNSQGRDKALKSPLGIASAQLAGEELIELLITRGADPNQCELETDVLPLLQAIYATLQIKALTDRALGTIKALLRHTRWGRQHCESVFSAVYQTAHLDLLKLLLECDDELKEVAGNPASEDPLGLLLKQTSKPIKWLDLLLANGHKFGKPLDVDVVLNASLRESSQGTQRDVEVVSALLRHGADARKPMGDTGETPIFLAYRHSRSEKVINALLDAAAARAAAGGDANSAAHPITIDPYGRNELHALAMAPGKDKGRLTSLLQRGVDPRQKDVAGNSVYIYAVVHQATWMMAQLMPVLPPRYTDGRASGKMLGDAGDEQRNDDARAAESWMEERVEWNLRRPMTRAMKDHLERSLIGHRLAQRGDTAAGDDDRMPPSPSPAAPLLDEQQRQIVKAVVVGCELGAEEATLATVEVVEEDEWARRNAAHEMCLGALGDRFVKLRGKSMLYLLIKQTCHHTFVNRVMNARPELVLAPNQGANTQTPLEEAATRGAKATDCAELFRNILIKLDRANLAIPMDLRQKVMRCLLPSGNAGHWASGLRLLALLGPVDVNEPDPESGLPLLHQALEAGYFPSVVVALLRLGADVNVKDKHGRTALSRCRDNEEALPLLLAAGANLDAFEARNKHASKYSEARLTVVAYSAHVSPAHTYYLVADDLPEMAYALLLRRSELVEYFKRPDHKSPLWALTKCSPPQHRSVEHLRKLIALFAHVVRDIDYDPGRRKGHSLVRRISQQPKQLAVEVLRLVIPFCAADLCQLDERGRSCLDVALATGNEHFLDYLAHLTTRSATTRNGDKVRSSSSSPSAEDGSGGREEARRRLGEQARKLLKLRNGRGQPALVAALRPYSFASQANLGAVRSLTRLDVDVNEREAGTGNTALHYAATTNSVALCKHLIDCGAEINARNEAGETALFIAGRHNHWHTTLFLLLSGADGHATNKAGQCVLVASSALCAAVIHDFVMRPRSLEFIARRLLPLLCPEIGVTSLLRKAKVSPSGDDTESRSTTTTGDVSSNKAVRAEGSDNGVSLVPPADEMIIEASSTVPLPQQHEEEEELQPLGVSFPEIVTTMDTVVAASPATNEEAASDDADRMALETNAPTNSATTTTTSTSRRTGHDDRRQEKQAVARVTALLERVLEALQLYQGAPAETDPAVPRADNEDDLEMDRRVRWERNESLVRLKGQLTRWLKASKARIPRITRNLSFSTLSESEMALYLRQWKALQQQKQKQEQEQRGVEGRKRKRVDDTVGGDGGAQKEDDDDSSQSSSQGVDNDDDDKHIMIEVKRPRLSLSCDGDDDDLPREPCLVVPEVAGTIPLPPPFLTQTDLLRPSADQPVDSLVHVEAMIQRTATLVHDVVKASVIFDVQSQMSDDAAQPSVGLVADDQGYLLDAFLTRPPQLPPAKFDWMVLQAVVALPADQLGVDRVPYYAVRGSAGANETAQVFKTNAEAVAAFDEQFKALTGHAWADRSQQQQRMAPSATTVTETAREATATTSAKYLFLPTNHEAVLQQFGHAAQAEQEAAQVLARLPKPGEAYTRSAEERVFDLLSFVSSKHQILSYCNRVGLLEVATLGQLTAAQLKNAFNILDVISGILTYEEELKWRGRPLPQHVQLARQNLSHAFHCVLPFDFAAHASGLINTVVIDDREKLNQKIDIVQSLQEIGIGLEVLQHDTSLPPREGIDAGLAGDDDDAAGGEAATVSGEKEKHSAQTLADESSSVTSNDKESKLARMRLLCKALCTKLTPLDKQSDEWDVIEKIMKPGKVQIMDIFAVERKGEAERYRPYANLPNRMLLGHGTGVANVMGILRKGLCVNPIGAKPNGSSLGKGLYFSDQPEKSLKYMKWRSLPKVGCFLLCETALGEALVRRTTGKTTVLPPGRHHLLGLGKKSCDPSTSLHTDEGVKIPLGLSPVQPTGARLPHNEFVLHNEDQVRIRYLVLVRG